MSKRYDLCIKLLNELNGDTILDIKMYAPDEKSATEMKNRFLSHPTEAITKAMNIFLKDKL